ncbi:head GIN domain-containing protein [Sediminibacterium sp. KACHI17]|jgi:hypothetical protein|uniref:Head GIN domain-containing protein n=1 Tax=Sediminibacterium sp. KACHI17 TaxID=1751071 RepID=A0AAT9GKX0_9BACT
MQQNKWIIGLCSLLILFSSCTKSITGEGPTATQIRSVANFSKIKLNGSGDVEIVPSNTQQVIISGYTNLLEVYESKVQNGELLLGYESRKNIRNDNIKVRIETPDIRGVNINGSGDVVINGFLQGTDLTTLINGSGRIRIQSSAFNSTSYNINGSGDIFAAVIPSKNTEANITGSGFIELNCSQNLKIRISGSGTIDYYGNPPATDIAISGSGVVRKK